MYVARRQESGNLVSAPISDEWKSLASGKSKQLVEGIADADQVFFEASKHRVSVFGDVVG